MIDQDWTVDTILRKFKELSEQTFPGPLRRLGLFRRLQDLLRNYFNDGKYDLTAVNQTFSEISSPRAMFKPQVRTIKVAVTATTAEDAESRLFTNRNGPTLEPDVKYSIVRLANPVHDIAAGDA